jgi:UDP-N-acetylglucosamine 1-carboxyvinyltransferase
MAATLLIDGEVILYNVPHIADVDTMIGLLRAFGLTVADRPDGGVSVINRGVTTYRAPSDLVSLMRASHYVLGPVALRTGRAESSLPGGCDLGERSVSHILAVWEALGIETNFVDGSIIVESGGARGANVVLDPKHRNPGATFTALMAASLAEGRTVIEHASYEPDVVCFCRFLSKAGALIQGVGTATLLVDGVSRLHGVSHQMNSDRLEAGTFICAAAATRGEVLVQAITREELGETADKLEEAGVRLMPRGDGVFAECPSRPRGVEIVTDPFPAFSTDLQPPAAALLAGAEGQSSIRETVFPRRLQYADELVKMGADVKPIDSRCVIIEGVPRLHGAEVHGGNIRDGAALVIAALSAEGESLVYGRRFVARGYQDLEEKLSSLGADITTFE